MAVPSRKEEQYFMFWRVAFFYFTLRFMWSCILVLQIQLHFSPRGP